MSDTTFVIKQGASGAVLIATLSDEDGVVNLDGYTSVTMTAVKGGVAVLDAVVMEIDADPATGIVSYEFDETTSEIAVGRYKLEIVATDSTGDLHVFPTDANEPFGTLVVQKRVI